MNTPDSKFRLALTVAGKTRKRETGSVHSVERSEIVFDTVVSEPRVVGLMVDVIGEGNLSNSGIDCGNA